MDVATTTVGLTDLKFRLVRDDFADAVAWVARTLPTRPTVPVLAGVLLTGSDDGLTISGFDYEVSAEVRLAAEIASPGRVLVSGRLLSDITRALPNRRFDWATREWSAPADESCSRSHPSIIGSRHGACGRNASQSRTAAWRVCT